MRTNGKAGGAVRAPSGRAIDPGFGVRVNGELARKYARKAVRYAEELPDGEVAQGGAGASHRGARLGARGGRAMSTWMTIAVSVAAVEVVVLLWLAGQVCYLRGWAARDRAGRDEGGKAEAIEPDAAAILERLEPDWALAGVISERRLAVQRERQLHAAQEGWQ